MRVRASFRVRAGVRGGGEARDAHLLREHLHGLGREPSAVERLERHRAMGRAMGRGGRRGGPRSLPARRRVGHRAEDLGRGRGRDGVRVNP